MRHPSTLLRTVAVIAASLVIFGALLAPGFLKSIEIPLLLLSVFLIGIPHGAIDHVMAAEIFDLKRTFSGHLFFYGSYLLIMLLVGAVWVWVPVAGMILFLVISVYHFGQADMEDFLTPSSSRIVTIYAVLRGIFLIGFIIFSDLDLTVPVMAEAMNLDAEKLLTWLPDAAVALGMIASVYVVAMVAAAFQSRLRSPFNLFLDSLLLGALFLVSGPLLGFAVYFALWHSAGHVREMRVYFQSHNKALSLSRFYWLATPFTLISLLGLFMLWGLNSAFQLGEQLLTLMFILISVLTLPHMLIVDRMYNSKTSSEAT